MQDSIETLSAMRYQEDTGYVKKDWSKTCAIPLHCEAIDMECRDQMAAWCLQVVDFCKFSRETVEIALSFLDRFLVTKEGDSARNSRNIYRLSCMAALYTAVKIHEPTAMDPAFVSRLSQGAYSAQEIEAMEGHLLQALKWRVNPPTSMAFVRTAMDLLPENALNKEERETTIELAQIQTELAMCNNELIEVPASTVAYCAVANALESLGLNLQVQQGLCELLCQALQINKTTNAIVSQQVQRILYESVVVQQQPIKRERSESLCQEGQNNNNDKQSRRDIRLSPRSISVPAQ